jgi:hypothetical protein
LDCHEHPAHGALHSTVATFTRCSKIHSEEIASVKNNAAAMSVVVKAPAVSIFGKRQLAPG